MKREDPRILVERCESKEGFRKAGADMFGSFKVAGPWAAAVGMVS